MMSPGLALPLSFDDGRANADSAVTVVAAQNGVTLLGCHDGTSLIFHELSTEPTLPPPPTPSDERRFSRASRPSSPQALSVDSRTTSRSISPVSTSSGLAPFVVASRSRISSGITKEQVEAPKNFVDFEEEPDKLKDMLKGKRLKRGSIDASVAALSPDSVPKRKEGAYGSLLSANVSPKFSPKSVTSPLLPSTQGLEFQCQIHPPQRSGQPQVVADILPVNDFRHLTLYVSGDLAVTSSLDGQCLLMIHMDDGHNCHDVPLHNRPHRHGVWLWHHIHRVHIAQSTFIVASGLVDPNMIPPDVENDDNQQQSRMLVFEYVDGDSIGAVGVGLVKAAEWFATGTFVGTTMDDGPAMLHYVSWQKHLFLSAITLSEPPLVQPFQIPVASDQHSGLAGLHNPFKLNKAQSADIVPSHDEEAPIERIVLEGHIDAGLVNIPGNILGTRVRSKGTVRILCWSDSHLAAFEYSEEELHTTFVVPIANIKDLKWFSHAEYGLAFADRVEVYTLPASPDSPPTLKRTIRVEEHQTLQMVSPFEVVAVSGAIDGKKLQLTRVTCDRSTNAQASHHSQRIYQTLDLPPPNDEQRVTSILPLELDLVITGHADGHLRATTFSHMCHPSAEASSKMSDIALGGYIVNLHVVQNGRTKERYVVGGADDGSIAFWYADSLKLVARWVVFITPLLHVLQFQTVTTGPLRGCVLCVSQDGTIAVFVIDGFQFLYIIPGSAFPLVRVCLGEDNLLVLYADQRARLWDIKTKEFWRSMTAAKAEELVGQGGWTDLPIGSHGCVPEGALTSLENRSAENASTLIFKLESFIGEAVQVMKAVSTSRNQTRVIFSTRDRLRSLLAALMTQGLNNGIDEICREDLGIPSSAVAAGILSGGFVTTYATKSSADRWCISEDVSASLALAIITALRALGLFEELTDSTNTVMSFYATSIGSAVGDKYRHPSLAFLAKHWLNGSQEIRNSARLLFDASVVRLSDEDATQIAEQWQHHLPCLQPTAERESMPAALSLFICGYLAAEKYSLFPTSTLTDISKSIQLYLHDEQSIFRTFAVDLCSRGFHIWQHYIDAMEILRSLFSLATSSKKEAISAQNVGAQARLAVLHIAGSNTPLFMTTLGLDILSPVSLEYRKSVLQIVAFLIRKRPLVLYPNLPKLMEAVVKSLDPNSTSHRDAVLDTATEILGHVVKTFPSVDFHMATQRLAVGTSEGALVMYDLKTAIRLYVLENHKKRIAACSFSPDGRRLVTLSLEESVVLVWKVGSSFSSFFNPGAPPRQGHSGSDPFKTLSFNVGDEGNMTIADSLHLVRFEWPADRSVKLKIRESTLTFST